jgi:phosphatidate cytidylyltransferase
MLKQRIITAVIALILLLAALFLLPPVGTRVIIAALMAAAAWEWAGLISLKSAWQRLMYVAAIGFTTLAVWWLAGSGFLVILVNVAVAWWSLALLWIFFYPTPVPRPLGWIAGALIIIPAWASLDALLMKQAELLLFVLLIVWAADIGAYFAGKKFGRVKLAPQVSPGKSWEGVIGGMLAVTLLTATVGKMQDIDLTVLLPLCLAVAVISVVGDLTVSMFKRSAGVKDSGTLFPGHGGVLDRIDSIMAAAPLFVFGSAWAGLG